MSDENKSDAPDDEAAAKPLKVKFRCVESVSGDDAGVEIGTPDGGLLRIEAGKVHVESDPRLIADLDQHSFVERVPSKS